MSKEMITVIPPLDKVNVVILLESGHSALVKRNNNEGSAINARFQQKAAMMGCIIKNMTQISQQEKPAQDQVLMTIMDAIGELAPEDFNSAGYPNVAAVSKIAGFKVTAAQLTKAFEEFQAQKA